MLKEYTHVINKIMENNMSTCSGCRYYESTVGGKGLCNRLPPVLTVGLYCDKHPPNMRSNCPDCGWRHPVVNGSDTSCGEFMHKTPV